MKVHVLPGIDPKTEQWANKLIQELGIADDSATVQREKEILLMGNRMDIRPLEVMAELNHLLSLGRTSGHGKYCRRLSCIA